MIQNKYINGNVVIHCPTEKEAKEIVRIAYELGLKWKAENSTVNDIYWSTYKKETCYSLGCYSKNLLSYGTKDIAYEEFEKVPASEFLHWYERHKQDCMAKENLSKLSICSEDDFLL